MKGLDCGTSNFVAASEASGDSVSFSRERNAYYIVSPKSTIHSNFIKKGLESTNSRFFELDNGDLVIIGQGAIDFAVTRDVTVLRPMSKGVIVAKDKNSVPILSKIMGFVLGSPSMEKEPVVFSVPAASVDVKFDVNYHKNTLSDELQKLGFNPIALNESEALCYSNLLDNDLTGACFSFGAGCVNLCLMHSGQSLVTFSTAKSGDFIDEMVGYDFDISPTVVQKEKESGILLSNPENNIQKGIAGRYRQIIKYALENLAYDFDKSPKKLNIKEPLPVVISGGTSMIGGFLDVFTEISKEVGLPFPTKEIRYATDPLYDVAKGCLLAAKLGGV